jgi:small GTP-binding protein
MFVEKHMRPSLSLFCLNLDISSFTSIPIAESHNSIGGKSARAISILKCLHHFMLPARYALKVILVGSSGVGKTSLMSSYLTNTFQAEAFPTVAATSASTTIQLADMNVDLQVWDTAGQERFQSISRMFYRESNVAFVCYDASTVDTIKGWVDVVRDESPDCFIFLVATKSDTLDDDELGKQMLIGRQKKEELDAKLNVFTSAVNGNGIRELFTEAAKCAAELYLVNAPNVEITRAATESGRTGCC